MRIMKMMQHAFWVMIFTLIMVMIYVHAEAKTIYDVEDLEGGCKLTIDGYDLNNVLIYTGKVNHSDRVDTIDHELKKLRITRYMFGEYQGSDEFEFPSGKLFSLYIRVHKCYFAPSIVWNVLQ